MRTVPIEIPETPPSFRRLYQRYRYYAEDGMGPIMRFLHHKPNQLAPTKRVLLLLFLGACLSTVGVQLTADEHLYGPNVNTSQSADAFRIHIDFRDLYCAIEGVDHPVLKNVTGAIKQGRLTAILGPSGSGKTTFLLQLLGKAQKHCSKEYGGKVFINGEEATLESILDWIGFVPQDDVLYSELTVIEALQSSADWRLPRYLDQREKATIINETLHILALDDIQHQRIGNINSRGISGGERKRTSVAMELVAKPALLVMDEPTSGLDSASAYTLVKMLRRVVDTGVSVVAVLHQPSQRIFELLDDLILMQDEFIGEAAYIGPKADVLEFLAKACYKVPDNASCGSAVSEFILDVLAGLEVPECEGCILNKSDGQTQISQFESLPNAFRSFSKGELAVETMSPSICDFQPTNIEAMLNIICGYSFCEMNDKRLLCRIISKFVKQQAKVSKFHLRAKPGLSRQVHIWFWDILVRISWRKGIVEEVKAIAGLATVVAYVRSYNRSHMGRANTNLFLSLSIGLLGMFGAVLNDDIGPVRRAASAGMLLGAHEFAVLAHNLFKGILSSLIYTFVYFALLYIRTGIWVCAPFNDTTYRSFRSYRRLHKFLEFAHIVSLNYLASSAIGSCICVIVNHRVADAYVTIVAVLLACHVLSFYSPNRNQIKRDTIIFNRIDMSFLVESLCNLSYVSYFLEAMFLWDPDNSDPVGRNYVLRYYGYSPSNKSYCCLCVFSLWTFGQALRYIVFGLQNSNDFHSLYDTPLFLNFIFKVLSCHVVVLLCLTTVQELAFPVTRTKEEDVEEVVDIMKNQNASFS